VEQLEQAQQQADEERPGCHAVGFTIYDSETMMWD
jgi:hypothetical protein